MKELSAVIFLCLGFAVYPATAQHQKPSEHIYKNIEEKYRELSASAEVVTIAGEPVAQHTRFIQPEDKVVEDYGQLRQIALIRHGEPDLKKTGKFSYDEARQFLVDYDSVGIVRPDKPFLTVSEPDELTIFCSSINRARATASYLFGEDSSMTVSPEFREFETSLGKLSRKVRLPIKFWTAAARVKWVMGLGREDIESFAEAKERARKAADRLANATEENPKAVLVAHGFLNRYIKQELEEKGWRVVRDGGHGYLGTTILAKIEKDPEPKRELLASKTEQQEITVP